MKICVIGRGWVGQKIYNELINRGHAVTIISHKLSSTHISPKSDYVVNCAGHTGIPNVDACEKNKKETIEANAIFPINLYNLCKDLNINLAHFSSGCIYQGKINCVTEEPNYFGSIYSTSKGISDSYLKDKCLLFRIRMPFVSDDVPKNLFTKLIDYYKNGKLYDGGYNSITDLDEAIKIACNLIENNTFGPYNLVNKGSVTNQEIAEMLGLINAKWYTQEEFSKVTTAHRSNCIIPCNCEMRDVKEALFEKIKKFKKNIG